MDDFLMMYRIQQLGLALQNCCLAGRLEPSYHSFRSLPVTMKSETATVRERRKGRCMQTAKEMHVKMTFRKVLLRQERDNKLSTPFKQVLFTVVQKNGNSVLV